MEWSRWQTVSQWVFHIRICILTNWTSIIKIPIQKLHFCMKGWDLKIFNVNLNKNVFFCYKRKAQEFIVKHFPPISRHCTYILLKVVNCILQRNVTFYYEISYFLRQNLMRIIEYILCTFARFKNAVYLDNKFRIAVISVYYRNRCWGQ